MKTYEDIVEFHGHSCPGLALGYRVALAVFKGLGNRAMDEELVAIVENNSCAVDAIQVITGCTFGKGNLVFKDYGKQVYTFIKRSSGKGIRISVNLEKPPETPEEKIMWGKYIEGDRSENIIDFIHNKKSAKVRFILDTDENELFIIKRSKQNPPPAAKIYHSLVCSMCGEKVMEPKARIRESEIVCLPCFYL